MTDDEIASLMPPTPTCGRSKYAEAEKASVQMLNPFVHKLELVTSADKIQV